MLRTSMMLSLAAYINLGFGQLAHAQPQFAHTTSLELTVVRADVVVIGKIADFKADTLMATLAVEETLKGQPRERYTVRLPAEARILARWKQESTRLLVAAKLTQTEVFDLTDGELEVMSADFSVLRKSADAIRVAKETLKRLGGTQVEAFSLRAPSEAAKGTRWGGRVLSVEVPVDDRLHLRALEYLQSKGYPRRAEGARALVHFKSDDNIARLKPLLNDPDFSTYQSAESNEGMEERFYDVRQAAFGTLQTWGVKVAMPEIQVKRLRTDVERLSIGRMTDELAARMRGFKNLRELSYYSGVNDAGLKTVAGFKQIERIHLGGHSNNDVTDAGIKELKALPNLTLLELRCPNMTDASLKELAGLKNLTTLDLTYANVNGSGLKDMACLPNLTALHLHRTKMNDAGMKALAPCSSLKTLYLAETRVTDVGMKELAPCQSLTSLFLGSTRVTDAGLKELAPLRNLTTLELYTNRVTDNTLRVLREADLLHALILARGKDGARPKSALEVLEFELGRVAGTQVTDAGLKELAPLKNLTTLYLPDNVTDKGLKELAQFKNLTTVAVWGSLVTDEGIKEFKQHKNLTSLYVPLSNSRLRLLRELGLLHLLRDGFANGGARPKSPDEVLTLYLRYTGVGDDGMKELTVLKNLETLYLERSDVTDEGLKHLAKLAKLRSLDLRQTAVTDAGLKHLEGMVELRELFVTSSKVTDAGVFALRKALPKCRIIMN